MKKIISSVILSLFFLLLPCFSIAFDDDIARYARYENSFDSYNGPPLTWQEMALAYLFVIGIFACGIYSWKKEEDEKKMLPQKRTQKKESAIDISDATAIYADSYYPKRKPFNWDLLRKNIDIAIENKLEITFGYNDKQGNFSIRHAIPLERYHKYNKEYIRCFDKDKQAERNFVTKKIKNLVIKD